MSSDSITLLNSINPRSAGMGMANVSNAKASEALSINPAGLSTSELLFGLAAPYGENDLGINISEVGYASKYYGFKLSYIKIDKIDETDDTGQKIGDLSVNSYALKLALGYTFLENYSIGVAANLLYEQAVYYNEPAFSFDLGTQIKIIDGLCLGFAYRNIAPSTNSEPSLIDLGISYDINKMLLISSELDYCVTNNDFSEKGGAELTLFDTISLRAGYDSDQNICAGFGLKLNEEKGKFDLAYRGNRSLPNSFMVSYALPFGGK
jgi:hypothetical protein